MACRALVCGLLCDVFEGSFFRNIKLVILLGSKLYDVSNSHLIFQHSYVVIAERDRFQKLQGKILFSVSEILLNARVKCLKEIVDRFNSEILMNYLKCS